MDIFSKEMLYAGGGEQVFVRPNLTANGTWGGNAFAVRATSANSIRPAYHAVDSNQNSYWQASATGQQSYSFYNPKPLKVTKLVILFASTSNVANAVQILCSNTNGDYVNLTSSTTGIGTTTYTITIENSDFYKYWQIQMYKNSGYLVIRDIGITATYKG